MTIATAITPVNQPIASDQAEIDPANPELARMVIKSLDIGQATAADYERSLAGYLDFIADNGLARTTLFDYKHQLDRRTDLRPATKNRLLTAARVYSRALPNIMGWSGVDLTRHPLTGQPIKGFQADQTHKPGLTADEVRAVAAHIDGLADNQEATRLRALVATMALAGLRQAEVCQLEVADVQLVGSPRLLVAGKGGGGSKKSLPIRPRLAEILADYLEAYNLKSGPMFFCVGNRAKGQRLTTRGLRLIVGNIFKAAGVDPAKSVHGLRHYFATQLIAAGLPLPEVANWTRHKSIQTLTFYHDNLATTAAAASCEVFADSGF